MSLFIKRISLYNPIKCLAILYPNQSTSERVGEVGTKHSHQILYYHFLMIFLLAMNSLNNANQLIRYINQLTDVEQCFAHIFAIQNMGTVWQII